MSQPTRQMDMREAKMRLANSLEKSGQLDVDLTGLPDDLEAAWITEHVRGLSADRLVMRAFERGYRVATANDVPKARLPSLPGRDSGSADEPIRFDGSILMVRPKELGDYEREYYRRETDQNIADAAHRLQRVETVGGDPATDGEFVYARRQNSVSMSYEKGRLSPKIQE